MLEIYLATITRGNDQFTSEQYEVLYNIASQHPYSGGAAVYSARAMIDLFFEDAEIENTERKAQLIDISRNLRKIGKLVPNPASKECYYIIELDEKDNGEFKIYDASGIMRNQLTLMPGLNALQIILTDYPAGVYVYKAVMQSGKQEYGKLIIVE